jgi:hypothetical protein
MSTSTGSRTDRTLEVTWRELVLGIALAASLLASAVTTAAAYHFRALADSYRESLAMSRLMRDAERDRCNVRARLGHAYASALEATLDGLGLADRASMSPAIRVIDAYRDSATDAEILPPPVCRSRQRGNTNDLPSLDAIGGGR